MHNKQSKMISITIPGEMYSKLERIRGDVSRSRYIMRLIEVALEHKK
jgi:metal-responsive CopG/Arc/MetJ family transcriptional regulator